MAEASAQERLERVRAGIAEAARKAGRKAEEVTLVAVSKTFGAKAVRPLIAAGQRDFGENRVGEAAGKWPALREEAPDIRLHMVGRLQSNKAEEAAGLFDIIHSLDRMSLLKALAKAMDKLGRRPDCFIQLDLEGEPQKGGCAPGELPALLDAARDAGIRVVGLMCLPPLGQEAAPYFALLAKHARAHGLEGLSMGMSADHETAVMLGATHVRIGTALFGPRE
ncbi:MAG: YggS family pyridoxal phosphate-dependent enzyme [Sphingomonadaceae bacterium]